MKRTVLAAALAAGLAEGAVLEVANDTAQTMSEWMAAQEPAVTAADLAGYDEIHFAGTKTLTLASELAGYAGVVRVKQGADVRLTQSNALGTTAGATWVEAGGTLALNLAGVARNGFTLGDEELHFEGTGTDGNGALRVWNMTTDQTNLFGKKLHLTGDALMRIPAQRHDFTGYLFTLDGHTLSLYGNNNCLNGGRFTAGHVKVLAGNVIMQNTNDYEGGSTNTLTYTGSTGHYQWWGQSSASKTPWTLVLDTPANCQAGNGGGAGTANIWEGPVELKKDVYLTTYNSGSGHRFKGYVHGDGKITLAGGNNAAAATSARVQLFLDCPTNAFKGGVDANCSTLHLSTNGALPAAGGALTLKGGSVELPEIGETLLPPLVCSGTGTVVNGFGAWRESVTKQGAGDLVYKSRAGAPLLDVQEGAFRLADMNVGIWEGVIVGRESEFESAWNVGRAVSNSIASYPSYCYRNTANGWTDYMYVTYSGYIWNHSEEPATWTFACCFDDRARLVVNGAVVFETTAWQRPFFGQATLQPGPNAFKWVGINWTGGGGGTAGRDESNNNAPTWALAKALAYHVGATDSTDLADYTPFAAWDGLLTLTDGSEAQKAAVLPRFGKVRLAAGVTFGAGGSRFPADELEGLSAAVADGGLEIVRTWTAPAADVNTNGVLAVAGELRFAEGATVAVDDPAALVKVPLTAPYTIARAASVTGAPAPSPALAAAKWRVRVEGGEVKLYYASGATIIIR